MNRIAARRLHAQRLAGKPLASPVDAVRWLTSVQAQDYTGAKWAVGQRSRGATDTELDRLFDEGAILRTHVMRPTWHFVLPEDVRWLLDLTGPKILRGLAARHRELELDEKVFVKAMKAFTAALAGGRHLTRPELGEVLRAARISTAGQRLPHLIMRAELEGLIVSGPRRGKQFTYALFEERVRRPRIMERAEAIAELTRRYFRSHGPAQLKDFAWWSGLTLAEVRTGFALAGRAIEHQAIEGKDYWFDPGAGRAADAAGLAHLLPNFDEYTVAYRDRADIANAHDAFASILSNVVTIAGFVRGSWRRIRAPAGVRVELQTMDRFTAAEKAAVEEAARRFGRFLEQPVELIWF